MSSPRALVGLATVVGFLAVIGACGSQEPPSVPPPATGPAPSASLQLPAAAPACAEQYTGTGGCVGETVQVAQVLDPATVVLTDGRQVRLAGVAAVAAAGCSGPAALASVTQALAGQTVGLLRPQSFGTDEFGHVWAYLTLAGGQDLGLQLARAGWATAYSAAPAAAGYAQQVTSAVTAAQAGAVGQFSAACAPPPAPPKPPKLPSVPDFSASPRERATPDPEPMEDSDPPAEHRSHSGHTGHTGHPCLAGERDGDHDGYCGEGR